ncbi:DUF1127 domain-containing protein [Silicimonas algicola]|uniref:Uncharacterized protein DUF1127 n=1 Tax=Silicimonas algicola TaxID=1826607 RepID=A0A316G283_9RHOB|nr:DUF1127 domain-containing protein [Silicimonas algicola]AZQ65837.1 DUF1127 domain-containing protein [Silicimonas algicola]PWK54782.1 uncharacterized protein DUF1127 [Silicimonas algicola]
MHASDTSSSHGHPLHALADSLARRIAERLRRRHFRTLLDLDDHILHDIGVTRGEVRSAANLPLSVNAAHELHRIARERRRMMM